MKRILMLAALLVFVCAVLSSCQKKQPQSSYAFEVGKTLKYRLWVNQQIENAGDRDNAVRISMRTDFDLTPSSVAPDGTAELKMRFVSASGMATIGAERKAIDTDKSLLNREVVLKMKPNGEIPELRLPEDLNKNHYSNFTKLRHVVMDMFTTLPQNLNNGTAWTRRTVVEEDVMPLGMISTETKTSFVAGGEAEVWQQQATEIAVNFEVRLGSQVAAENKSDSSPEDGMPQSINVSGGGDGNGKMYFDAMRRVCVGAAYETAVEMKTELLFEDATKNSVSSQKIKTGIVLKLLPEVKSE